MLETISLFYSAFISKNVIFKTLMSFSDIGLIKKRTVLKKFEKNNFFIIFTFCGINIISISQLICFIFRFKFSTK